MAPPNRVVVDRTAFQDQISRKIREQVEVWFIECVGRRARKGILHANRRARWRKWSAPSRDCRCDLPIVVCVRVQ